MRDRTPNARRLVERTEATAVLADMIANLAYVVDGAHSFGLIGSGAVENLTAALRLAYEEGASKLDAPPGVPLDLDTHPAVAELHRELVRDRRRRAHRPSEP